MSRKGMPQINYDLAIFETETSQVYPNVGYFKHKQYMKRIKTLGLSAKQSKLLVRIYDDYKYGRINKTQFEYYLDDFGTMIDMYPVKEADKMVDLLERYINQEIDHGQYMKFAQDLLDIYNGKRPF